MNPEALEPELKRKLCDQVRIVPEGMQRYVIHQPFMFNDGDHFVVLLKRDGNGWFFTDEAHTLMHVQYDELDLSHGTRQKLLDSVLSAFSMENRDGELRISVPGDRFGDAFFSFVQALNKVADLDFLNRERARTTFMEDVKRLLEELVPDDRRVFKYYDSERDPDRNYTVDCRINRRPKSVFVFFISSDDRCRDATIVCHQFEKWNVRFEATGIFEDQTQINRRALAQFSDVAYKQFASLGARERIEQHFCEILDV